MYVIVNVFFGFFWHLESQTITSNHGNFRSPLARKCGNPCCEHCLLSSPSPPPHVITFGFFDMMALLWCTDSEEHHLTYRLCFLLPFSQTMLFNGSYEGFTLAPTAFVCTPCLSPYRRDRIYINHNESVFISVTDVIQRCNAWYSWLYCRCQLSGGLLAVV